MTDFKPLNSNMEWSQEDCFTLLTSVKDGIDLQTIATILNRGIKGCELKLYDLIHQLYSMGVLMENMIIQTGLDEQTITEILNFIISKRYNSLHLTNPSTLINRGKRWTTEDEDLLLNGIMEGRDLSVISSTLGRTVLAIQSRLEIIVCRLYNENVDLNNIAKMTRLPRRYIHCLGLSMIVKKPLQDVSLKTRIDKLESELETWKLVVENLSGKLETWKLVVENLSGKLNKLEISLKKSKK
jgi:hypothetical protein